MSRLPGYSVSRLPGYSVSRLPGYSVSRLPEYSVSRLSGCREDLLLVLSILLVPVDIL